MSSLTAEAIRARWNDPRRGLKGLPTFTAELRQEYPSLTPATIRKALLENEAYALNARRINVKEHRHVVVSKLDDIWTADLADVSREAGDNDGIKFLLLVVDIFSKFFWVEPLRSKAAPEMVRGFQAILDRAAPRKPNYLWTDRGTEFLNASFKRLLDSRGIQIYHTGGDSKAAIAERAVRTLRLRLGRLADHRGTWKYLDALQDLVDGINNTVSRTHGMTPAEASKRENENTVRLKLNKVKTPEQQTVTNLQRAATTPKFAVGDLVRLSVFKSTFAKESTQTNWMAELFRVVGVDPGPPIMYQLAEIDPRRQADLAPGERIQGAFYQEELAEAAPPPQWRIVDRGQRRNNLALVGFLGWPKKYDRWIPVSELGGGRRTRTPKN